MVTKKEYFELMRETNLKTYPTILEYIARIPHTPLQDIILTELNKWIDPPRKIRLRPLLARLGYEACGGKDWKDILPYCAATEIFNISLYLFDDILDKDLSTRDIRQRVLIGNILRNISIEALLDGTKILNKKNCEEVIRRFNTIDLETYCAQFIDVEEITKPEANYEAYYKRCVFLEFYGNTLAISALFAAADTAKVNALYNFGKHLGTADQIINDISDFVKQQEDYSLGKQTLPVLYALDNGTIEEKTFIRQTLGKKLTEQQHHKLIKILWRTGAIDYAKEIAARETHKGISHLAALPKNNATELLQLAALSKADDNKYYQKLNKLK